MYRPPGGGASRAAAVVAVQQRLALVFQDYDLIGLAQTKAGACLFFQQIGVHALGAEHAHAVFEREAFALTRSRSVCFSSISWFSRIQLTRPWFP